MKANKANKASTALDKQVLVNLQDALMACWESDDARDKAEIGLTAVIDDIRLSENFSAWAESVVKQRSEANRDLAQIALTCYVAHTKSVPAKYTLSRHVRALIDAILTRTDAQMHEGKRVSWAKIRKGASDRANRNRSRTDTEPSNPTVSGITEPKGYWVCAIDKKASNKTKLQLLQAFAEKIGVTLS